MVLALSIVSLAMLLILVEWLFRRSSAGIAWSFFLIAPLFLTPYWLQNAVSVQLPHLEYSTFTWVKLYSVLACNCWFVAIRMTSLGHRQWCRSAGVVLFMVNITEAIVLDLRAGDLAQWMHAASGALLVLALPIGQDALAVDSTGRIGQLIYRGMTRNWIIGYTIWNAVFVYLNFPALMGHQLAVLASALIVGLIQPQRWLQARACTFSSDLVVSFTFPLFAVRSLNTFHWSCPSGRVASAACCLAALVTCVAQPVRGRLHSLTNHLRPLMQAVRMPAWF